MDELKTVTLGGKAFKRLTGSTAEHDFWLMAEVRSAGLDKIDAKRYDSPEQMVDAILDVAISSGKALRLLAGCIIAADAEPFDWTPAMAAETERHLARLTAKEDKEALLPLIASLLIYFFETGLSSLKISPKSSEVDGPEREEESETVGQSAGS